MGRDPIRCRTGPLHATYFERNPITCAYIRGAVPIEY
jgi:hypothetical protein